MIIFSKSKKALTRELNQVRQESTHQKLRATKYAQERDDLQEELELAQATIDSQSQTIKDLNNQIEKLEDDTRKQWDRTSETLAEIETIINNLRDEYDPSRIIGDLSGLAVTVEVESTQDGFIKGEKVSRVAVLNAINNHAMVKGRHTVKLRDFRTDLIETITELGLYTIQVRIGSETADIKLWVVSTP